VFVWRGAEHTGLITPNGAVLTRDGHAIELRFVGATELARPEGVRLLPGRTSYFIGDDPEAWVTGARRFARVRLVEMYPGIDLVWHTTPDGALEYDLHLDPGTDPDSVRLAIGGARASVLPSGNLRLSAPGTDLHIRRPVAFQIVQDRRRAVAATYEVVSDGSIGLELGAYNRDLPLIVDPVLEYSTYLGGTLNDWGTSVAAGDDGSTIAVGYTDSHDFPLTEGHGGQFLQDVFVTKLAPDGTLVYSAYIGGGPPPTVPDPLGMGCDFPVFHTILIPGCGMDIGNGVAMDGAGNAYVVGFTTSRHFPIVQGMQDTFAGGQYDGFIAKLGPDGDDLLYSTYLGGMGDDLLESVEVHAGRVFVVGTTGSSDFPTERPVQPQLSGTSDAVALALTPSGSALEWSTYLGGLSGEWGDGIATDGAGNAYVVGHTGSTDFPTRDAFQPDFGGGDAGEFSICPCDGFVSKIDPFGALAYSSFLGGASNDKARDVAADMEGRAHVIGVTLSTDFPVEDPFQAENRGPADGFITSFAPGGERLEFSTYFGGSYPDEAAAIDVDPCGNLYAAGYTPSRDFPLHRSLQGYNPGGTKEQNDGYVAKFDRERTLVYSTLLGGATYDGVFGLAVDPVGTAHVVGFTGSDNFPVAGAAQPAFGGATDAIAARITDEPCDPDVGMP
jgi:hypothetical protein